MKKRVFSFILALFLFSFSLFVPFGLNSVSASSSYVFEPSSANIADYLPYYNALISNSNFQNYDGNFISAFQPGRYGTANTFIILDPVQSQTSDGHTCFYGSYLENSFSSTSLETVSISFNSVNASDFTSYYWFLELRDNGYFDIFQGKFSPNGIIPYSRQYRNYGAFRFSTSFVPDYNLTGVVVGFDFSVEAFTQWLIDTEKYKDLPSYIGTQKLKSFVQFYHDWGSSNSIFVIRLVEWLMHFNLASQTLDNRNILKSTIDRLYQEYKNSAFVQINHDSSILPHHRKNIQTNTTDDDLTLVTDDPSDDTLISILRDILRGVISIPNSIYDNTQVIISKLDQLNHNIIISNNGGAFSGSDLTPVLDKMDDIIEALGADTVSVDIDQTTKDNTDDFFDDWNLEFKTALDSKFPVASQLNLFFTDFFERCGIDADSDGEVYQYYSPGVLTASSVSRSVGTASEDDIVTDFLGQFDNSDPAFLDDASFHGVPDLSVSVGGHSVSIIDFRVYAKYRDKIHFIISFVIWTLYLLHLYKALPSIIGQVADVATKTSEL